MHARISLEFAQRDVIQIHHSRTHEVGQAVENFKTRNELTSYTKGDPDKPTVVVTTKKKARKVEKKAKKAEEKASKPKSSKSKSSNYKPAKVKTPKAKYGIGKGKKGFQKKRKN